MKQRIIKQKEYVLEGDDARVIETCLDYCFHRLAKHKRCGISKVVDVKKVNKLRSEF